MTSASVQPAPHWTLTGLAVQWRDGERATLSQSTWKEAPDGWQCLVSIPFGRPVPQLATVQLEVRNAFRHDADGAWIRARDLIASKLRQQPRGGELHLGTVTVR